MKEYYQGREIETQRRTFTVIQEPWTVVQVGDTLLKIRPIITNVREAVGEKNRDGSPLMLFGYTMAVDTETNEDT